MMVWWYISNNYYIYRYSDYALYNYTVCFI